MVHFQERGFFRIDSKLTMEYPRLTVYDVTKMSTSQLKTLTGDIVCAWCYSDRLRILEDMVR